MCMYITVTYQTCSASTSLSCSLLSLHRSRHVCALTISSPITDKSQDTSNICLLSLCLCQNLSCYWLFTFHCKRVLSFFVTEVWSPGYSLSCYLYWLFALHGHLIDSVTECIRFSSSLHSPFFLSVLSSPIPPPVIWPTNRPQNTGKYLFVRRDCL